MRIAVAQSPGTRLEQWRETLALIDDLIQQAAGLDAEFVVLPECVWPAYDLGSRQAYRAARAAGLPDNETFLQHVSQQARLRQIAVCVSYVEERDQRLFNAACLLDSAGSRLGVQRKCFLWDFDHDWFEPGSTIAPVQSPKGRIGLMVCADARLPEIPATLAARGARLFLQPTGWVNVGTPERLYNPQPEFIIPARAAEFGIPIASASKWAVEGGTTFVGSSLICDAEGNVLARCGQKETAVVAADVELTPARRPQLTDAERALLLSSAEPLRPRGDVPPLAVLPLPLNVDDGWIADHLPKRADAEKPLLALTYRDEGSRSGSVAPTLGEGYAVFSAWPAKLLEVGGVCIAATSAADAGRFAPLRCLALRGVHVVVVFGSETSAMLMRTRACENRVFVLQVEPQGWLAFDPGGDVVVEAQWPVSVAEAKPTTLDVARAADKTFAPRTDMLTGRRPGQYAF